MSGMELVVDRQPNYETPFYDYLADYIRADKDFMDGIRRGIADCIEGRLSPWSDVKKELGIG